MRLRVVRPCPTPEVVRGGHCERCNQRVHDLGRSRDPAADLARLGGKACVRVLAATLVLGGCSGAVDALQPADQTTPAAAPQPDAGTDGAPAHEEWFVGEVMTTE